SHCAVAHWHCALRTAHWHCALALALALRTGTAHCALRTTHYALLLLLLRGCRCRLHLDAGGGHPVLDRHLLAHLQVAGDLRARVARDLPFFRPFLYDHRVGAQLEDRAGHLVGLAGRGGIAHPERGERQKDCQSEDLFHTTPPEENRY